MSGTWRAADGSCGASAAGWLASDESCGTTAAGMLATDDSCDASAAGWRAPEAPRRADETRASGARAAIVAILALLATSSDARADRPTLADEATYGAPGGELLIHYATAGIDAVPVADANADGVPDFVAEVASEGERALAHFMALGFRRPLDDGTLGGDGRVDIYLRDLQAADGNAATDSCEGERCVGYVSAENDYVGYAYPSRTEAIRSVIPHELFHLVQNAYSSAQPATWTEGSAVWAVENLYGADNSDFERFLPAFVTKTYRPFERPVAGFGDGYPYGAALWPYFLERRYGVDAVVGAWLACESSPFLDATATALGVPLDDAWAEFTRWNAFTGTRAELGPYESGHEWPEVPREAPFDGDSTTYVEGLSARYVPIEVAERSRIVVGGPAGLAFAAWSVADDAALDAGEGLVATDRDGELAAAIDAGSHTLVVTGLARGTIATAIDVRVEAIGEDSGCNAGARSLPAWLVLVGIPLGYRRRKSCNRGRT